MCNKQKSRHEAPQPSLRLAIAVQRATLGTALGLIALSPAYSQELGAAGAQVGDQGSAAKGEVEEVTVTGSRLSRTSFESPTPVSMVAVEDLQNRGVTNFSHYLSDLPSFQKGINTPETTTLYSLVNGATYLDLRGLGTNRTLVLLNGRRHVPSASNGSVDMNVFPSALIQRIDVVTGGASAAYGSDAIAGVVNVITDNRFTGIKANLQYGSSTHGDAERTTGSFAFGSDLLEGRANLTASLDYERYEGVLTQTARDWGRNSPCIVNNPADTGPSDGIPARVLGYGCTLTQATEGGRILTPGSLSGYQFGPGGALEAFVPGTNYSPPFMVGGSGADMGQWRDISVPYDRHTGFVALRYSLTDTVEFFAEGTSARSHGENATAQHWDFGSITIQADNAFIPQELRTILQNENIGSFTVGRVNTDMGFYIAESTTDVTRYAFGLEGTTAGWKWDAYLQSGETRYTNVQHNNRIQANFLNAIDAVTDPLTGEIVCRQQLTGGAPGCVPMNIFGSGSPSAAAMAYAHGDEFIRWTVSEEVVAASASRNIPTLPGGPLAIAFGGEYRKESSDGTVDPLALSGGYRVVSPTSPVIGSYDVSEGFVELAQPLLKDIPFASLLELNAAGRWADYSTAGNAEAWKLGVSYFPVSSLQFRGLLSQDVRAPNLSELYARGGVSFATINDPVTNTSYAVSVTGGGNPDLTVESAKTKSLGFVYKPTWLDGLAISLDWFDITVSDSIGGLNAQQLFDFCQQGNSQACSAITRDQSGIATTVSSSLFNIAERRHTGVDVQAAYVRGFDGGLFGGPATLALNLEASQVSRQELSPNGLVFVDRVGEIGANVGGSGVPKWRGTLSADYSSGPLGLLAQVRYIGGGKYLNAWGPEDYSRNDISAVAYLGLSARYNLDLGGYSMQLYGGADNVLDKDPPVNPENFFITGYTNYGLYDVVGRRLYAGVRVNF
jgi:outer membrane receptor protein involved in Fe transport